MKKRHQKIFVADEGTKQLNNNIKKRKTLSCQLRKESTLVKEESMKVLAEFDRLLMRDL